MSTRFTIKRQILLTTTLVGAALASYGRRAYAACVHTSGTSYLCSGANASTQNVNANNAAVTTATGFSVNTNAGNAIAITGDGALSFTDANASTISTSASGSYIAGVYVKVLGDAGGTAGSSTITTGGGGHVTGSSAGISTINYGTGAVSVTANGGVNGNFRGIFAKNYGTNLAVTTGSSSTVSANQGIATFNHGTGNTNITVGGTVSANNYGVYAINYSGTDLTVTTNAGSNISASTYNGINSVNNGTGALAITTNGDVQGNVSGIVASNSGTSLTVTTGAASHITSSYANSLVANNYGTGATSVTINGAVSSTHYSGVEARNGKFYAYSYSARIAGTNLTVNQATMTSTITGDIDGISAENFGTGYVSVTANGHVTGTGGYGIQVSNGDKYAMTGTNLSIATGASSIITGNEGAILAENYGSGYASITVNGQVTSAHGNGIRVSNGAYYNHTGTSITITTGAASVVSSNTGVGIIANNYGSGFTNITVNGSVTGHSDGIYAENYLGNGMTITTGIGSSITGTQDTGISAANDHLGALTMTINGNVTGAVAGISAGNSGTNLTITTGTASAITSTNGTGIFAVSNGSGATSITLNGNVTGDTRDGVFVRNGQFIYGSFRHYGTTIAVDQATSTSVITGHTNGIEARSYGSGDLTITANGHVTGTTGNGIEAVSGGHYGGNNGYFGGHGITIATGAASQIMGAGNGIYAFDNGNGNTTITANGMVTGTNANGIYAYNSRYAGDLNITTGAASQITGHINGITARNYGYGAVTITTNGNVVGGTNGIETYNRGYNVTSLTVNGDVAGNGGDGVKVSNGRYNNGTTYHYGTNMVINQVSTASHITGATNGIEARNYGSGYLSVTANGHVTGTSGDGILAHNSVYGTDLTVTTGIASSVTGGGYGIEARNYGSGVLSITANGTVSGGGYGIFAYNTSNGTSLTITTGATSTISSSTGYGIRATNFGSGALSITANGIVIGANGYSIIANNYGTSLDITTGLGSMVLASGDGGILANNFGTGALMLTADGNVTGYNRGISVRNNAPGTDLIVTTGAGTTITGNTSDGILARNKGSGITDITVNGNVTGNGGDGIKAYNGLIYNGNLVHYGTNLIINQASTASHITGSTNGIEARNYGSGYLSVTANGHVTGTGGDGILAHNSAYGTDLTITTGVGSVVTGGTSGIYARNYSDGTVTITANGNVTGGNRGIYARNSYGTDLTVTTGVGTTVMGTSGDGIYARNYSGTLTITANGNVTGGDRGIFVHNDRFATDLIVTTGAGTTVTGTNGYGVYAISQGRGALMITANGNVTGVNSGIYASNRGYSGIFGTDLAVTTGVGTTVTGTHQYGIYATNRGSGTLTISANGNVTGHGGIFARNVYGTNLGVTTGAGTTVTATSGYGIDAFNYGSGTLSITADGNVTGRTSGISAFSNSGTDLSVTTEAGTTVTGTNRYGISADNHGSGALTITANGNVMGGTQGIYAKNYGGGPLHITVAGDVTGATGIQVYYASTAGGTITNLSTGIIHGTGGTAIELGGLYGAIINGPISVIIDGGHIIGNIIDAAPQNGFSTVEIAGDFTSQGSFDVSHFIVDAGKTLTVGLPSVISSQTAVEDDGTILSAPGTTTLINGALHVATGGTLAARANVDVVTTLTNDGMTAIASGAVLTTGHMAAASSAGTLVFGVVSPTDHGKLVVNAGPANLTDQTVDVAVSNQSALRGGQRIQIIDGAGAIVGGPGAVAETVHDNSLLYNFALVDGTGSGVAGADASQAYLEVSVDIPAAVDTANNAHAAMALANAGTMNPQLARVQDNLNNAPTPQAVNDILSSVTPTVDMSAPIAAQNVAFNTFDLTTTRIASLSDADTPASGMSAGDVTDALGVWGQAFGSHSDQDERGGIAGYNANTFGGAVGIDTRNLSDNAIVGVAVSYGRTTAASRNVNDTHTDTDSYQATLYGDYDLDPNTYLDGMLAYSWNRVDETRHAIGGLDNLNASGNFHANQFSGQAELGRHYYAGKTILTPHVLFDALNYDPSAYTESGAGGADLHVDGKDLSLVQLGGGIKAGWKFKDPDAGVLKPELGVGYKYAVVNDRLSDTASFTGGGTAFQAQGPAPSRSSYDLSASLTLDTIHNWSIQAAYELELRSDYVSNTGTLKAAYRF